MAFPLDLRDMMHSSQKIVKDREKHLRIAVFIDAEAPQVAVDAFREVLLPQSGNARLHVEAVVPGDVMEVDPAADVVIALAGPGVTLERSLANARDHFIPTVVAALGVGRDAVARRLHHPVLDVVTGDEVKDLIDKLGSWLGDKVQAKRLALAANFAFVRRAVAEESVKNTAFQNAVIGGVAFIPGADLPLMTANQAKMVMQIAGAYGQPLGAERVKELATVVGGAFVLRTIAREFVGLIPGFGWAIKAGIGYSGTIAMGYAAIEYFERGGDMSGVAEKVREARDKAIETARRKRVRGVQPAAVEPAEAEFIDAAPMQPPLPMPESRPSGSSEMK